MTRTKDKIAAEARNLGFDAVRFTAAELPEKIGARMQEAVALGRHGTMVWLEDRLEKRAQPKRLWPEVRSAVVLGMNYGPEQDPLQKLKARSTGNISVYAQGDDYHDVIKKRLKALARFMTATFECDLKVFVDTAPVPEKPLAEQAGLGWQGKHTNLVSREFGSWLFLGVIYTTLDLEPDEPEPDHCGSCRQCLDICPTNAFPAPYQLDARLCISYLTIEHKGDIPEQLRPLIGNRIYGCDDCLAVCPWNKFAEQGRETKLAARDHRLEPSLAELAKLDDESFRQMFRKSPIKRIGRDRFVRNVAIAIGNSGDVSLLPVASKLRGDGSATVRRMADWAVGRLQNGRIDKRS